MSPMRSALAPFVVALLVAACAPSSDGEPGGPSGDTRPHIVLVVCDTLRADHLDLYGYERDTAPRLAAWAREATVYETATAASNWTRPSVQALFTGQEATVGHVYGAGEVWRTDVHWLPELLQEAGYQTVAATANLFLGPDFGGSRGFDRHVHTASDRAQPGHWKHLIAAEGLLDDLSETLATAPLDDDRPVFLYVHLMEPHIPYDPPPEYRTWCLPDYDGPFDGAGKSYRALRGKHVDERLGPGDREQLIGLYDGEVRRMDDQLARLREMVDVHLPARDTLTIVTSDHGEAFGEGDDGYYLHGFGMGDELLHVPLVVHGNGPGRVTTRVGLVDLFPSLLETAEADVPDDIDGVPLRDAIRGREFVAYKGEPWKDAIPGQLAVVRDEYRAVRHEDDRWRLYRTDTGEDVSADNQDTLRELVRASERWARTSRERVPDPAVLSGAQVADDTLAEQLEALGYADESPAEPDDDPKGSDDADG